MKPHGVRDLRWVLTSVTCHFRSDKPSRTVGDLSQTVVGPFPTGNGSGPSAASSLATS